MTADALTELDLTVLLTTETELDLDVLAALAGVGAEETDDLADEVAE